MKLTVICTLEVEVEVPDDIPGYDAHFAIEENGCPGTGPVGRVIEDAIEASKTTHVCWACNMHGENKIKTEVPK